MPIERVPLELDRHGVLLWRRVRRTIASGRWWTCARTSPWPSFPIERRELGELLDLGDRILRLVRERRGPGIIAECVLRSGAELSARVRKGEAGSSRGRDTRRRSAGHPRQARRVDVDERSHRRGIDRFVSDAIELAELSQEDPFAGPPDPKLLTDPSKAPDLELYYDPAGGSVDAARAITWAKEGEAAALAFDPRITNSEGATFGRTAGR